jgi:hypothetical protein
MTVRTQEFRGQLDAIKKASPKNPVQSMQAAKKTQGVGG